MVLLGLTSIEYFLGQARNTLSYKRLADLNRMSFSHFDLGNLNLAIPDLNLQGHCTSFKLFNWPWNTSPHHCLVSFYIGNKNTVNF